MEWLVFEITILAVWAFSERCKVLDLKHKIDVLNDEIYRIKNDPYKL